MNLSDHPPAEIEQLRADLAEDHAYRRKWWAIIAIGLVVFWTAVAGVVL